MTHSISNKPFVPGLDTRIAYAKAKINLALNLASANEEMVDVYFYAKADGYRSFYSGIYNAPRLISEEADLLQAWEEGQADATYDSEMAECPCCRKMFGDPCPTHG